MLLDVVQGHMHRFVVRLDDAVIPHMQGGNGHGFGRRKAEFVGVPAVGTGSQLVDQAVSLGIQGVVELDVVLGIDGSGQPQPLSPSAIPMGFGYGGSQGLVGLPVA